jgi:phosphate uptake regulator
MELFSTVFFEKNFKEYVKQNENVFSRIEAMNSYYRSMVSSIIQDQINKNSELIRRIRNLDEAYKNVK